MNVMMPIMDGYAVLKELQADVDTTKIPFLFITVKGDRPDSVKGVNLGSDDYISKPFTIQGILEAIELKLKIANQLNQKLE